MSKPWQPLHNHHNSNNHSSSPANRCKSKHSPIDRMSPVPQSPRLPFTTRNSNKCANSPKNDSTNSCASNNNRTNSITNTFPIWSVKRSNNSPSWNNNIISNINNSHNRHSSSTKSTFGPMSLPLLWTWEIRNRNSIRLQLAQTIRRLRKHAHCHRTLRLNQFQ